MIDRILAQKDLLPLLSELAKDRRIVGPVKRNSRYFYEELRNPSLLDLDFDYCTFSPRSFLLPASETLFKFDQSNGKFVATPAFDTRPMALIGVHPCDIHAICLLDRVFTIDHHDQHYMARRENAFVVGIDCPSPCVNGVFCADMHTNAAAEGFDVMLYKLGERYAVVFGTEMGRDWIVSSKLSLPPRKADLKEFEQYRIDKSTAFPAQLSVRRNELPAMLKRAYDSLLWEATAKRCYSCGSCNLVCPTCYCFNIYDEPSLDGQHGERRREWDGCMLRDFASVAGGHNFRSKSAQRLRHRIYRKAEWIEEQTGLAGCVGCARCDRACTAKISIVEILNQLAEEKSHAC